MDYAGDVRAVLAEDDFRRAKVVAARPPFPCDGLSRACRRAAGSTPAGRSLSRGLRRRFWSRPGVRFGRRVRRFRARFSA